MLRSNFKIRRCSSLQHTCVKASIVVARWGLKGARTFDAQTGEFEDLLEAGFLDQTKAFRSTLQAVSLASLLVAIAGARRRANSRRHGGVARRVPTYDRVETGAGAG